MIDIQEHGGVFGGAKTKDYNFELLNASIVDMEGSQTGTGIPSGSQTLYQYASDNVHFFDKHKELSYYLSAYTNKLQISWRNVDGTIKGSFLTNIVLDNKNVQYSQSTIRVDKEGCIYLLVPLATPIFKKYDGLGNELLSSNLANITSNTLNKILYADAEYIWMSNGYAPVKLSATDLSLIATLSNYNSYMFESITRYKDSDVWYLANGAGSIVRIYSDTDGVISTLSHKPLKVLARKNGAILFTRHTSGNSIVGYYLITKTGNVLQLPLMTDLNTAQIPYILEDANGYFYLLQGRIYKFGPNGAILGKATFSTVYDGFSLTAVTTDGSFYVGFNTIGGYISKGSIPN